MAATAASPEGQAFEAKFKAQLQAAAYHERYAWALAKRAQASGLHLNEQQRETVRDAITRASPGELVPDAAHAVVETPGRARKAMLDTERRRKLGRRIVALLWWHYRRKRAQSQGERLIEGPYADPQNLAIEKAALAMTGLTVTHVGADTIRAWWKGHSFDLERLTKLP